MAKQMIDLNSRFPSGTYVYVGRRTFRHESEPEYKQEERLEKAPEQYPHTFVDFSGSKVLTVLEHAGGKQGVVVDTQKVVRPKDTHTLAQIDRWRKAYTSNLELAREVVENCTNLPKVEAEKILVKSVDEEGNEVYSVGEPYVVIDFRSAGAKLDIPLQPIDKLNLIKERATLVYENMLAHLPEEEQLVQAVVLYDQLITLDEA